VRLFFACYQPKFRIWRVLACSIIDLFRAYFRRCLALLNITSPSCRYQSLISHFLDSHRSGRGHKLNLANNIGGPKSTEGIRIFSLRRNRVIKMGKIRFNHSLAYNDLRQITQRITKFLFCFVNGWLRCLYSTFRKMQVFSFCLSVHHQKKSFRKYFCFLFVPLQLSNQKSNFR
jgi:hypothetical protein